MCKYLIILVIILQFSSCSTTQQADSIKISDNKKTEVLEVKNDSKTIAEENFEKEWKSKFDKTLTELDEHRNLWKEKNITDYDFVVEKYAGGNTNEWNRLPVLIRIRGNELNSIEKVDKDKDFVIYSKTDGFEEFDSVEKLFDYLQKKLEEKNIINVEYDQNLGFPKNVYIIHSYESHNTKNIKISSLESIS